MFANDPLQSQLSSGAYPGAMNPFTSPYTGPYTGSMQTSLSNPFVTQSISPFGQQGYSGFAGYSPIAQQLQHLQQIQQLQVLASILASQNSNPQWQMQQQPNLLQNPLIAATLQNPLLAQQLLQQQNPFTQSGFPLAPQSWIGQQFHPHQQYGGRGIY
jgi:hypothetical protein